MILSGISLKLAEIVHDMSHLQRFIHILAFAIL